MDNDLIEKLYQKAKKYCLEKKFTSKQILEFFQILKNFINRIK